MTVETRTCPTCGADVPRGARGRPRRYCSDPCRKQAEMARASLADLRHWLGYYTAQADQGSAWYRHNMAALRDEIAARIDAIEERFRT